MLKSYYLAMFSMFVIGNVVYTDTVRDTMGRPEMVDMDSSTRLWLLPTSR